MRDAGTFEFHSHTHTHSRWDLTSLDVPAKREGLSHDLMASRAFFAEKMAGGRATVHLCWPQGYFDTDYLEVADQAGFTTFYTTDSKGLNRAASGTRHIYRLAVRNRGGWLFGQRVILGASPLLTGIYHYFKSA